jgi:hypothetical protein
MGSIDGGALEALTFGDDPIILDVSEDGHTLIGFVNVDGEADEFDGTDVKVIEITLDPNSDDYTVTMSGMFDNGEETFFDDFSGIGGGNKDFFPLNSSTDPGSLEDLLVTGLVPGTDSVNTDSDDVGTNDQWLNNNTTEIIRLDYVTNVSGDPTDISTLAYTAHYTVNDAGFRVRQLQGSKTTAREVKVTVYDTIGDPQDNDFITDGPGDSSGTASDERDTITSVTITDATDGADYLFEPGDLSAGGFTVTFNADGSVNIDGLFTNDEVEVATADGYNQMEIMNVTDGGQLGIALDMFSIDGGQLGDPIDLSFDLAVTDEDGDAPANDDATLDITLLPEINGTGGADDLSGNGSAEILNGLGGADTLTGNGGDDILNGGTGADTFVFNFDSSSGTDVGVDGNDAITDLALGETLQFDDVIDSVTTIGGLEALVTVVDDGTDTTITYDTGGATITLENVSTGVGPAGYDSLAELDVDYNLVVVS